MIQIRSWEDVLEMVRIYGEADMTNTLTNCCNRVMQVEKMEPHTGSGLRAREEPEQLCEAGVEVPVYAVAVGGIAHEAVQVNQEELEGGGEGACLGVRVCRTVALEATAISARLPEREVQCDVLSIVVSSK